MLFTKTLWNCFTTDLCITIVRGTMSLGFFLILCPIFSHEVLCLLLAGIPARLYWGMCFKVLIMRQSQRKKNSHLKHVSPGWVQPWSHRKPEFRPAYVSPTCQQLWAWVRENVRGSKLRKIQNILLWKEYVALGFSSTEKYWKEP